MLTAVACDCWGWALRYFGDCVCSRRDAVSLFFGLASIALWGVSEVPQIVTNFIDGRSEGVSDVFLLTWTIGDFLNVAGCVLSNTLPTQLYTAVLYTLITLSLDVQHLYYAHLRPRWSQPRKRGPAPRTGDRLLATTADAAGGLPQRQASARSAEVPLLAEYDVIVVPLASPAPDSGPEEPPRTSHYGSLRSMSSFHSLRGPLLSSLSLTRSTSIPHPSSSTGAPHWGPSATTFRTASTGLDPTTSSRASQGPDDWPLMDSGDETIMGIIGHMDDFPPRRSDSTPRSPRATMLTGSTDSISHADTPTHPPPSAFEAVAQEPLLGADGLPVLGAPARSTSSSSGTSSSSSSGSSTSSSTSRDAANATGRGGAALRAAAPATLLTLYLLWSAMSNPDAHTGAHTQAPTGHRRLLTGAPQPATAGGHLLAAAGSNITRWREAAGSSNSLLRTAGNREHEVLGQVLGWGMTAVYVSGRLPQILKNHRRKSTAGLSVEMFALVIAANLTYTLSILIRSTAWADIKPRLPWLVDACLCLVADFIIMGQVVYFRHIRGEPEAGGPPHSDGLPDGHGHGHKAGANGYHHAGMGRQGSAASGHHKGVNGSRLAPTASQQDAEENYNHVIVSQHV